MMNSEAPPCLPLIAWDEITGLLGKSLMFSGCFVLPFRATTTAYGGSQARGLIRAAAASLHHGSQQHGILNPLSEARDRTCNLLVPSQIRFHCATSGTPNIKSLTHCTGPGIKPVPLQRPARSLIHCTTVGTPHIFSK